MKKRIFGNFDAKERKVLGKLNNPLKVQGFVDDVRYAYGKRISPLNVLREKRADCLEAAVFACAALKYNKIGSFLVNLRAVRDEDHVLCVYRLDGKYGSIAQSKFLGLRGRQPVYSSVRELVMSYFEHFFNFYGEISLREFSIPFRLGRYRDWAWNDMTMLKIEEDTDNAKHYRILADDARLPLVSKEKFWREIIILPKQMKVGKKYRNQEGHP